MPYLFIYLFDWLGVPWLLVGRGTCGWGWCAPSWFGWVFVCAVWMGLAWGVAWALAMTTIRLIQWRSARAAAGNHSES
jgi:hypothetical protein